MNDIIKAFNLIYIIKNGFFAVVLTGVGIFLVFDAKNDIENKNVLIGMAISFFVAGAFLVYRILPKTKMINTINSFASRIKLGLIIFMGIFVIASANMLKNIMHSNPTNWTQVVIFIVFIFSIGQLFYNNFIKKK
jgi:cytochrome bd-type quinol oxidase subunit 2